jgi:hypothetical protein
MDISINKSQLAIIQNKLGKASSKDLIKKVIFKIANRLETEAKQNISKLTFKKSTGKLLQSVSIAPINDFTTKVYVGAKYGLYINRGTGIFIGRKSWVTNFGGVLPHPIRMKGFKPRPFWTQAIKTIKAEANNIIKKEVEKYVN